MQSAGALSGLWKLSPVSRTLVRFLCHFLMSVLQRGGSCYHDCLPVVILCGEFLEFMSKDDFPLGAKFLMLHFESLKNLNLTNFGVKFLACQNILIFIFLS